MASLYGAVKKQKLAPDERGRAHIKDLVKIFRRHALGSEGDIHLNHVGFQELCFDLKLGSHDVSSRLFSAMDTDNTGAVDVYEFWKGLLSMHDVGFVGADERLAFAFNLFNVDRSASGELDDRVAHKELVGFLTSFYLEACDLASGWLRRWIDHFEAVFGERVASVRASGSAREAAWQQTAATVALDREARHRVRLTALDFADSVLALADDDAGADGDHGSLGLRGFQRWCEADDKKLQLRVLSWLEGLGSAFLERSGITQHF